MKAPIYLYLGPEAGERNDAIELLKKNVIKEYGDIDEYKYYYSDIKLSDVVSQLDNVNLFASSTFVVLVGAEQIKTKDEVELLKSWLLSPGSSILVLVSSEISVDKKLENIVPKENKTVFWELFDNKKEAWIQNFFRKNGYSINADGIESMLDMVENNTESMKSAALMLFSCFPSGHSFTNNDVEAVLAHNREETAFTLFEVMADSSKSRQTRFEGSLEILQKLMMSKSSSAPSVIAGLNYCFKMLNSWQLLNEKGYASDAELKSHGFTSKKVQNRYRMASSLWTIGQTSAIISLLSHTDMLLRSIGGMSESILLNKMLYEILIKNGASCIEYESSL